MDKTKIARINALAKKAKTVGLNERETAERDALRKEYLAVVRGIPEEPDGVLEDLLFRDAQHNKTFVVQRMRKGVRPAKLAYRCLAQASANGQPCSLVQVRLYTGRTHQIRVHLSHEGHPLVGDIKYGDRRVNGMAKNKLDHDAAFACVSAEVRWSGRKFRISEWKNR